MQTPSAEYAFAGTWKFYGEEGGTAVSAAFTASLLVSMQSAASSLPRNSWLIFSSIWQKQIQRALLKRLGSLFRAYLRPDLKPAYSQANPHQIKALIEVAVHTDADFSEVPAATRGNWRIVPQRSSSQTKPSRWHRESVKDGRGRRER